MHGVFHLLSHIVRVPIIVCWVFLLFILNNSISSLVTRSCIKKKRAQNLCCDWTTANVYPQQTEVYLSYCVLFIVLHNHLIARKFCWVTPLNVTPWTLGRQVLFHALHVKNQTHRPIYYYYYVPVSGSVSISQCPWGCF